MGACNSNLSARAAASSSVTNGKPLMCSSDRATTKQILDDRFKVDLLFIIHATSIKSKMHKKLLKARETISSRSDTGGMSDSSSRGNQRTQTPKINLQQYSNEETSNVRITREKKITDGIRLIKERMDHLSLKQIIMDDDGNCQFRSIAHQLYSNANKYHRKVRLDIVNYIKEHKDEYNIYFESDTEFQHYVKTMSMNGTWGDELTLKAASNTFHCTVHVITSEKENYYVCYKPDSTTNNISMMVQNNTNGDTATNTTATTNDNNNTNGDTASIPSTSEDKCGDIFLAYISPIHYNSIQLCKKR